MELLDHSDANDLAETVDYTRYLIEVFTNPAFRQKINALLDVEWEYRKVVYRALADPRASSSGELKAYGKALVSAWCELESACEWSGFAGSRLESLQHEPREWCGGPASTDDGGEV